MSSLGVDVGGTYTKWAVLVGNAIVETEMFETPSDPDSLGRVLAPVLSRHQPLAKVSVALPAVLDAITRRPIIVPNLPAPWANSPVDKILAQYTDTAVRLCNDARAFALAEARLGAGQRFRTIAAITLGTGVGGGLVIDGQPYLGHEFRAGEFGHLTVYPGGALCACGGRGCLEAYAGGRAMLAAANAAGGAQFASPRAMIMAAERHDPTACWAMNRAGEALGHAVRTVSLVAAPEVVIFGGGMSSALPLLRPAMLRTLDASSSVVPLPAIVEASLGPHAGAIGAALWEEERHDGPSPEPSLRSG